MWGRPFRSAEEIGLTTPDDNHFSCAREPHGAAPTASAPPVGGSTRAVTWWRSRSSLFDPEAAFLDPWALVVNDVGPAGSRALGMRLAMLAVGPACEWKKGALDGP